MHYLTIAVNQTNGLTTCPKSLLTPSDNFTEYSVSKSASMQAADNILLLRERQYRVVSITNVGATNIASATFAFHSLVLGLVFFKQRPMAVAKIDLLTLNPSPDNVGIDLQNIPIGYQYRCILADFE